MTSINKIFKVLNEIVGCYSALPMSLACLDTSLTVEIVRNVILDGELLNLTKGELTILKRFIDKDTLNSKLSPLVSQKDYSSSLSQLKSTENKCKVGFQATFTVFMIHEYCYGKRQVSDLRENVLKKVENIMVIDSNGDVSNNLISYSNKTYKIDELLGNAQTDNNEKRTVMILSLEENMKKNEKEKERLLEEEIENYLEIISIYHSHVNLRVCMYKEKETEILETRKKLTYFLGIVEEYKESEDDYDVILREDIPENAFIKVLSECGVKIGYAEIESFSEYHMVSHENKKLGFYSFKVLDKDEQEYIKEKENQIIEKFKHIKPPNELVVWVLIDGLPYLSLLPVQQNAMKKRKKRGFLKNNQFIEMRSIQGYTRFEMKDRICEEIKVVIENKKNINENIVEEEEDADNDSLNGCSSQYSPSQTFSNVENPSLASTEATLSKESQFSRNVVHSTFVISIKSGNLEESMIKQIIEEEMIKIYEIFIKERKEIYYNMQVEMNMGLIHRMSELLDIDENSIYNLVYLKSL